MKKYDVGLLVGRFNVFHIGHKSHFFIYSLLSNIYFLIYNTQFSKISQVVYSKTFISYTLLIASLKNSISPNPTGLKL